MRYLALVTDFDGVMAENDRPADERCRELPQILIRDAMRARRERWVANRRGTQRIDPGGEMTVTAYGLDEVRGRNDDPHIEAASLKSRRAGGRCLDVARRPALEGLAGFRIDRRGILPVTLVELENVRGVDSRELPQVHNLLIVTRLVCPSRAADGGFSPFHA